MKKVFSGFALCLADHQKNIFYIDICHYSDVKSAILRAANEVQSPLKAFYISSTQWEAAQANILGTTCQDWCQVFVKRWLALDGRDYWYKYRERFQWMHFSVGEKYQKVRDWTSYWLAEKRWSWQRSLQRFKYILKSLHYESLGLYWLYGISWYHELFYCCRLDLDEDQNLWFKGFRRILGIPIFETKIFQMLGSLASFVSKVFVGL